MTLKQVNILIVLGLFLLFDFLGLFLYQNLKNELKSSQETSQEIIANYNVRLNVDIVKSLASKINPDFAKDAKQPAIVIAEPKKEPKEENISIYLYNGNGIVGDASSFASFLQEEGYILGSISNADKQDYVLTIIKYASESELIAQDLQSLAKSLYNEISLESSLDDLDKIEIILGQPAQ